MKVDVEDLVGVAEIAQRLGVKKTAVHNWRKRNSFPEPVHEFDNHTVVWLWPDVQEWMLRRVKFLSPTHQDYYKEKLGV